MKEAVFYINIVNEVLGRETHIELKEMERKTYSKPFEVAIRGGTVDNLEPPQNGLQVLPRVHLV